MTFKLLAEHHLEFLSLKGGCTGMEFDALISFLEKKKKCLLQIFRGTLSAKKLLHDTRGHVTGFI